LRSTIRFADKKIKEAFGRLRNSKTEDKKLYEWLKRAFQDIENNAFCGTHIQRKLFPKEYITKYKIKNLWKYDLPNGWRLVYSVGQEEIFVISVILEWFDHKDYEKRFKY